MKKVHLLLLIACAILIAIVYSGRNIPRNNTDGYAELIFDNTYVHKVEVTMSEEDRADQLANPKEKT